MEQDTNPQKNIFSKKPKADKKLKELEKKLQSLENIEENYKKLYADYKRLEDRAEGIHKSSSEEVLFEMMKKLTPVFDSFYRASTHAPEVTIEDLPKLTEEEYTKIFNYFIGLRQIEKQMEEVLGTMGLKRIPTKDQLFDHNLHEAITHEENQEVPADHIIDEIEAGWMFDDKVIKCAKVRVSKG